MSRISAESARLLKHLDSLEAEAPLLADMGRFASQARSAHSAKTRSSYASRASNLFSWLEGRASGSISKALKKGVSLGLAAPYERDIARFTTMKKSLRSLSLRLQSAKQFQVPHILAARNPKADMFADNISRQISTALANLASATKLIDKAQATAQAARAVIMQGKLPVQYTAIFLVQKKMADTAYSRAQTEASQVYSSLTSFIQSDTGAPTVRQYASTAGEVISTFASKAGSGAQWVGEEVQQAAVAVEKGAPAFNAMLKFWPVAALGLGALYLRNFLPSPKKS